MANDTCSYKWNERISPVNNVASVQENQLKAYEAVKELIVDLGLPASLEDVGIKKDLYEKIVEICLEHQIVHQTDNN